MLGGLQILPILALPSAARLYSMIETWLAKKTSRHQNHAMVDHNPAVSTQPRSQRRSTQPACFSKPHRLEEASESILLPAMGRASCFRLE